MTARQNAFSFANQSLQKVVAHGGTGEIRTIRVVAEGRYQGFNFIDLTEVPPGSSIGVHTHGHLDEEVYVVISGEGRMTNGAQEFTVGPGDVVVNPAGGTHGLTNAGNELLRLVVLDVPVSG